MRPHTGVRKLGIAIAAVTMTVTPLAFVLKANLSQHAYQNEAKFIFAFDDCDARDANPFLRDALTSLKTNDFDESEAIDRALEFINHFERD